MKNFFNHIKEHPKESAIIAGVCLLAGMFILGPLLAALAE